MQTIHFCKFKQQPNLGNMKFMTSNISLSQTALVNSRSSAPKEHEDSQYYYNILYPSSKIQCDDCRRDISTSTKILCNQLDYCVSCFTNTDPFPPYYYVIGKLDFPLLHREWTTHQELLLFQGLEKFGFGNWAEIAEFMGSDKTKEEVQQHYVSHYLQMPNFLPTQDILAINQNGKQKTNNLKRKNKIINNQKSTLRRDPVMDAQIQNKPKNNDNPAEIVGYLPKRREFEVEYDNDAELLLAELQFNDDDSPDELRMKFRIIDIYNQRLAERNRRKDFVIDRNLLDLKEQTRLDKARSKEDKEVYNMMKIFTRFNSSEDHEKLVQGIIREKEIRQRLQELKQLKAKGFKNLSQVHSSINQKASKQENHRATKASNNKLVSSKSRGNQKSKREMMAEKEERESNEISSQEEQLCRRFGITSGQYALIKQTMIREAVKQGVIGKEDTVKIFRMQRNVIDGIFDFLVSKQQICQKTY